MLHCMLEFLLGMMVRIPFCPTCQSKGFLVLGFDNFFLEIHRVQLLLVFVFLLHCPCSSICMVLMFLVFHSHLCSSIVMLPFLPILVLMHLLLVLLFCNVLQVVLVLVLVDLLLPFLLLLLALIVAHLSIYFLLLCFLLLVMLLFYILVDLLPLRMYTA